MAYLGLSGKVPIRALFVNHTAKLGGGEIALLNLVRSLDSGLVHPIVLLCSDGPLRKKLGFEVETHVVALPDDVGGASKDSLGWRSLLKLRAVWTVLRHARLVARFARLNRADVIHTNSLKADIIGGLAGRMARIPVIWHVRDRIDPDYLPPMVVRGFRLLGRTIPNYVIANSAATLSSLRLHVRPGKTGRVPRHAAWSAVVHDGCRVDLPHFTGEREHSGMRIGLIGRISPWKGQDVFLRAAALVLREFPSARFVIIGAPLFAEREFEIELHELCRKLRIEKAVEFTGFIDDVAERMAQLDIVVHASTTGEPFGQVIIEGMAAGKPIVATNGGGVPEIVEDGVTGILVPMGDAEAMGRAIVDLLRSPELREQMGAQGQRRVRNHFTLRHTASKVEAVYREILGCA